jgi:hypothetical protein
MTASAFEVAAIFIIKDEASASLKKISTAIKALSAQMKLLAEQGEKLTTSFGTTFTKMDAGIEASTGQVGLLTAAWGEAGIAARQASMAGGGGLIM